MSTPSSLAAPRDPGSTTSLPEPGRRRAQSPQHSATKEALIRCGVELCTEKGFQVTGIDEVLKRVGVPKGSFYHFFENKQLFGQAVIDAYAEYFQRKLDRILGDTSHSPLARLRNFVDEARRGMDKFDCRRGCLVGNLGQELAGLNDSFRVQLEATLMAWQETTAECLREAVAHGELPTGTDTQKLAAFFWIGWEGAILRAKLARNTEPLQTFADYFFALLGLAHDV